jgi:hypothetical protein
MRDCSLELTQYHDERVKLSEDTRKDLRAKADANEKRLTEGLEEAEKPLPLWFAIQGSYAMRTTVQHPLNNYDIDNGVVFAKKDLVGDRGGTMSPLDSRQMVCDAVQDDMFNKQPERRQNCVRVYYNTGYHVDLPVYRVEDPDSESEIYELASSNWKQSSPTGVTDWFDEQVKTHRGTEEPANKSQMRRMVRLLKKFAISRDKLNEEDGEITGWYMPSGFVLTKLVTDCFTSYQEREDEAFKTIVKAIYNQIQFNFDVYHPVIAGENLTKGADDPKMVVLKDKLEWAIGKLDSITDETSKKKALRTWDQIFNEEYFEDEFDVTNEAKSFSILSSEPTAPVDKKGGNSFG